MNVYVLNYVKNLIEYFKQNIKMIKYLKNYSNIMKYLKKYNSLKSIKLFSHQKRIITTCTREGSKLVFLNFSTNLLNGTPCCNPNDIAVAKQSIIPETIEPSLDILIKISHRLPSGYIPACKYPL